MGGATSNAGLGLYYMEDPTGRGRTGPMVYETASGAFQVLVPVERWLRVTAECLCMQDAALVQARYLLEGLQKEDG